MNIVAATLGQALVLLPNLPPPQQNNLQTFLQRVVTITGVGLGAGTGPGEGGHYPGGSGNITDWLQHVNVTEWVHSITSGDY